MNDPRHPPKSFSGEALPGQAPIVANSRPGIAFIFSRAWWRSPRVDEALNRPLSRRLKKGLRLRPVQLSAGTFRRRLRSRERAPSRILWPSSACCQSSFRSLSWGPPFQQGWSNCQLKLASDLRVASTEECLSACIRQARLALLREQGASNSRPA